MKGFPSLSLSGRGQLSPVHPRPHGPRGGLAHRLREDLGSAGGPDAEPRRALAGGQPGGWLPVGAGEPCPGPGGRGPRAPRGGDPGIPRAGDPGVGGRRASDLLPGPGRSVTLEEETRKQIYPENPGRNPVLMMWEVFWSVLGGVLGGVLEGSGRCSGRFWEVFWKVLAVSSMRALR